MSKKLLMLTALVMAGIAWPAYAADWIVAPSYYTHDPATGRRVSQYRPIPPVYTYARADYLRSGYRNTRSSIQAGGSTDHLHIVEEWGRPVRPYGEWRFPFRPYSVPYALWGPPYAGLNTGGYYPGYPGGYYPGGYYPGRPRPVPYAGGDAERRPPAGANSTVPPWAEGAYPQYRSGLPQPAPQRPARPHAPRPAPRGAAPSQPGAPTVRE